jgi:hypothetical protein
MMKRRSKTVRMLAVIILTCPLVLSMGCNPVAYALTSLVSAGAGWLTASLTTNVTTQCYSNGELVDCGSVDISD